MQSSTQIITINKPTSCFLQARCPFALLSPNQQCQSTEGKKYHIPWTCLPQAHLGSSTLSLTTNSSRLPWERVAMPLISPLMPVPQKFQPIYSYYWYCCYFLLLFLNLSAFSRDHSTLGHVPKVFQRRTF